MQWIPDIVAAKANLVKRQYFKVPGNTTGIAVPAGAKFLRALAQGCGGQGTNFGGSGAFARRKIAVLSTDTFSVQVGNTSTASTPGDSAVWKGAVGGTVVCYADRGRGDGTAGLAVNSIGDVTRDGHSGPTDGAEPGDAADLQALGFQGLQASPNTRSGDPGGGGVLVPYYSSTGAFAGYTIHAAGQGLVCLEWWDADPGY